MTTENREGRDPVRVAEDLWRVAEAVAKLDTFEPDSGWPMGQACRTCRGFGAYTSDLADAPQPDTGSPEAEWDAYRAFTDRRDAEAVAAINHDADCPWVLARKLVEGCTPS